MRYNPRAMPAKRRIESHRRASAASAPATGFAKPPVKLSAFDYALSIAKEDLEVELAGNLTLPSDDFLLNPRRLRGSDFLMRWNQGVWSERKVIDAVNATGEFYAIPYGPSGTAPNDIRGYEMYFERLESAGLADNKRPDILVFAAKDKTEVARAVSTLGGEQELPFTSEENLALKMLLGRAITAIECENSLWLAQSMPDYGSDLRPMQRLHGKKGLPKSAVVPTVILKEEDRARLLAWQERNGAPIHIWHLFHDLAFGISLNEACRLISDGFILPTSQTFHAPSGASSTKSIYKIYYHYAYRLGSMTEKPSLAAESITDPNGHIMPYVKFEGGKLILSGEAVELIKGIRGA